MSDTVGMFAEAMQLARDLGYEVREEPLGELPGGRCAIGGATQVLLNLEHAVADRLDVLLRALAADPRLVHEPKSRLLEARIRRLAASS